MKTATLSMVLAVAACTSNRGPVDDTGAAVAGSGLIAYPGMDGHGHQQLFTVTADGNAKTQLTFDDDSSMPSWSPDGTQLVYVTRKPATVPALWIMDADGGNKRSLTEGDAPDWGPDGDIVFCKAVPGAQSASSELFVVSAAGGTPRQISAADGSIQKVHPSWSQDGSRIVYVEWIAQSPADDDTSNGCPALSAHPELWSVNADGSDPRLLIGAGSASNLDASGSTINSAADANAPDCSPVGDDIVFWSGQESCYGQVWRAKADGSARLQLTHQPIPSHNDDPAWSPDGEKVLFSTDRNGSPELWMMDADGGNPHFVAANKPGPGPGDAAWQPVLH